MNTVVSRALPPGRGDSLRLLINFVGFQCGWFGCVLGAARGWPGAGAAMAAAIVATHVVRAARPAMELKLVLCAVAIGAVWDSTLAATGWISFSSGTLINGLAPPWMLALWALFAITLNVSLAWLKGRWFVAALLGAVSGPLSYWAGARLGALSFAEPRAALIALSAGWAIMTPLLVAAAQRFNGVERGAIARG